MFGPLECPQKAIIMLVYLVLACPVSKNLQSKSNPQWLGGFEKETLKAKGKGKVMFNEKACIQNVQVRGVQLWGSRSPKSCHPKFICASAVPGQVCKTIDRIFSGEMNKPFFFFVLSQDILEKVCIFGALPPCPHLPIQGSCLVLFERKLWKEKGTREARIQDLPSKVHSWRFWRGNFDRTRVF